MALVWGSWCCSIWNIQTQCIDNLATQAAEKGLSRHAEIAVLVPLQALRDGESYELCLTTRLSGPAKCQPWACYRKLRQLNPAPYGAWLSFANGGPQVVPELTPASRQHWQQRSQDSASIQCRAC